MSDEEKLIRFSTMISRLNNTKAGRVKVKPKETVVKKSQKMWDEKDSKTLREYVTESDVDDELKWGRIAKKLNRTTLACQKQIRMILDCGFMAKRRRVS